MDALELFNQLYYNRADTDILSDLSINDLMNPVYGNSFRASRATFRTAVEFLDSNNYLINKSRCEKII